MRAARWALSRELGYTALGDGDAPGPLTRLRARRLARRLSWSCPPWHGEGRLLDGGLGARLFGRAWSSLELPRHLSHFSPATLARTMELAGGEVVWSRQQAKPRHYLWSLGHALRDRRLAGVAQLTERRAVYGVLKLALEVTLPVVSRLGAGEGIRVGVVRRDQPAVRSRAG